MASSFSTLSQAQVCYPTSQNSQACLRLTISTDRIINFIANGATCIGFNLGVSLSREQQIIFDTLRSLIPAGDRQKIHIELFTRELASADLAAFKDVLQCLPGGNGPLLPTIDSPEYSSFVGNTVLTPHVSTDIVGRTPNMQCLPELQPTAATSIRRGLNVTVRDLRDTC